MQLKDADVIAWLREQPDKRFFELVYAAAEARGPGGLDRGRFESRVILGYATRERANDGTGPWSVELVALPRDPHKQLRREILCEDGAHCGHDLVSWAKEIRCPLCGADTYAT